MTPIRNVEDYVEAVSTIRKAWFKEPPEKEAYLVPWCRGQEKSCWRLIPKFYRKQKDEKCHQATQLDRALVESEIREEFCRRAPALADYLKPSDDKGLNKWEWYFVMQHHSAPTRLLDWTKSALTGLYFAVRTRVNSDCNAAVWVLNPWELNKRVFLKKDPQHKTANGFEVIPPSDPGTDPKIREKFDPWLPARFEKDRQGNHVGVGKKPPVAVYPVHTMRRIGAQRSCFTIHGSREDGFKEFEQCDRILRKIEVVGQKVEGIRRSLETCGIDETAIYPDLDGLGREMAYKWKPWL